jgi:phosphoribosylamine--glycine ligase
VLVEEHLEGEEASVIAVCDGERFVLLPAARDFKRAHDGDRGPNTGGMGAIAPAPSVTPALETEVAQRIIAPVLAALRRHGTPYRGALYAGLMLTATGPQVIEFNVRFGDPETQAILPLVGGSLAALLAGAAAGHLDPGTIARRDGVAVSVALVDRGYPEASEGGTITGLDALMDRDDLMVFHAGTARAEHGWTIRGGRAVHVAAAAATLDQARARVYAAIDTLGGSGWRVRRDIGALPAPVRSGR